MNRYSKLLSECAKKGIRVKEVSPHELGDYMGMNSKAAKKLGYQKMPPNTIYIDRTLSINTKANTLKHEIIEMNLMKKGKDYFDAHRIALRLEKK